MIPGLEKLENTALILVEGPKIWSEHSPAHSNSSP
jgi:hypothetical protein